MLILARAIGQSFNINGTTKVIYKSLDNDFVKIEIHDANEIKKISLKLIESGTSPESSYKLTDTLEIILIPKKLQGRSMKSGTKFGFKGTDRIVRTELIERKKNESTKKDS